MLTVECETSESKALRHQRAERERADKELQDKAAKERAEDAELRLRAKLKEEEEQRKQREADAERAREFQLRLQQIMQEQSEQLQQDRLRLLTAATAATADSVIKDAEHARGQLNDSLTGEKRLALSSVAVMEATATEERLNQLVGNAKLLPQNVSTEVIGVALFGEPRRDGNKVLCGTTFHYKNGSALSFQTYPFEMSLSE